MAALTKVKKHYHTEFYDPILRVDRVAPASEVGTATISAISMTQEAKYRASVCPGAMMATVPYRLEHNTELSTILM
jgi:hypothetical protein